MEPVTTPLDIFLQILPYLIPIFLLQLILVVVSLVDLIRREKTLGPKWIWYPIILFISLIGPVSYLVIGRKE